MIKITMFKEEESNWESFKSLGFNCVEHKKFIVFQKLLCYDVKLDENKHVNKKG